MNINDFCVILDNGHGANTTGKRSPDGRLREYAYTREITRMIKERLARYGINCELIVPEDDDITLVERVKRCNLLCAKYGRENCVFVSVHNNAAGCGGWLSARGWSVFVYRYGSERSKQLADCLYDATAALKLTTRKPMPTQKWWECGFYVCKYTNCPAVLTENFFQDNREDMEFLLSEKGKDAVTQLHVVGLLAYYRHLYGVEPKLNVTKCKMI